MCPRLRLLPLLLLIPLVAQGGVEVEALKGGARYRVTFSHQPVIACERVNLAGSFNGWSKSQTAMLDPDGDGIFVVSLELSNGKHHYKFVVNGSVWEHDGNNPRSEPDGHSGFNSVLELGSGRTSSTGTTGDGEVSFDELRHDSKQLAYACAVDGGRRLVLRIHVLRGDVEDVRVLATPRPLGADRGKGKGAGVSARRIAGWEGRDVYEARLTWKRAPGRVRYTFQLEDGDKQVRFPAGRERFDVSIQKAGRFQTPEWVRDAVFYQIFPDRFCDGDPELKASLPPRPEGKPYHIDDRYSEAWDARPGHFNFMGGDLPGVRDKLDYLAGLGVNTLYLNPIFAAGSNHRYDASDYEKVDPALGSTEDLRDLRSGLQKRKMRMILDCVFNHTGDTHYAFQDAMKKGSQVEVLEVVFLRRRLPSDPVSQAQLPGLVGLWLPASAQHQEPRGGQPPAGGRYPVAEGGRLGLAP